MKVRRLIFATLIFSVFANLLMLTGPLFMLQIYDRVLASRSEETLIALFALVAVLYFFYWIIEYARGRVISRVGARLDAALGAPAFRAVIARAARRRKRNGSLQDIDAVRTLFASPVILALFDAPWTPVFLAAIFIFHPVLGWVALAGGAILIVAALLNQILTSRITATAGLSSQAAAQFARQVELSGDYVVAQGMREPMIQRWQRMQDAAVTQSMGSSDWTGSFSAFIRAFRLFLQSAMLAVGAWFVLQNELTAGAMIAASILLGRALAPIETGVSQWPVVQRGREGWSSLRALLRDDENREPETILPTPTADLELRSVSLYLKRGDPPVLSQVSFRVKPGEALGIIGRSGSGKTTLARIAVGLVAPTAGEVRLAGATLDQYGPDSDLPQ